MGALIIILEIILLLSGFGFSDSVGPLQCFNDYETELKCSLVLDEPNSCSENKLNASLITKNEVSSLFTCHFDEIRPGACECTIEVLEGIVVKEIFTMNVMKGDKIWYTENITTHESIKPRRPIITSVIQKANGNFLVTVNTTYQNKITFSNHLVVELTYSSDGSNNNMSRLLGEGRTTYEIVGRHLQPNSKYILKARMKSTYPPNKTFSDHSEPYVFKTPQSLQNILKIIIPVLCLILIICISSIHFWYNRIFKPWWDKIPTPRFSTDFIKQVPKFLSFQTEVSSVSLDSSANHITKKTCVESSQVQGEDRYYNVSLGKGVDSAPLICSSSGYRSMDENSSEDTATSTSQEYKNQRSNESSSIISNRSNSQSNSSNPSFFGNPVPTMHPGKNFLELYKNLGQKIQMDLEYSVLNGCTDSGNSKLINITPPNNDRAVVLAYECTGDREALSAYNNPILEKPLSTMKPQASPFPVHDSILILVEEGYQAF